MAPSTEYKSLPSDAVIVKAIKQGQTHGAFAKEHSVSPGAASAAFYRLETTADPSLAIKATAKTLGKAVVRARNDGLRWERIAARSGRTIKEVQEAWEGETGKPFTQSYSGRGRRFEDMPQVPKSQASKPAPKAKAAPAKKATTKQPAKKAAPAKARTRAERAGKSKDPS